MNYLLGFLIRLRYTITVKGLEEIGSDERPILFLPNHPALIDPVILMNILLEKFSPRPLADEGQVKRLGLRRLMRLIRAVMIPDSAAGGRLGRERILRGLRKVAGGMKLGDNILLYPAGRLMRNGREQIGANSAVEYLLREVPGSRVVLVRTSGLWGSSFSRAGGAPSLVRRGWLNLVRLLCNGFLFMPRRQVLVEFHEPSDFPRESERLTMNRYLENYYNARKQVHAVVSHYWFRGAEAVVVPDSHGDDGVRDTSEIPQITASLVLEKLVGLSGEDEIHEDQHLGRDLGLDSLALVEFVSWLGEEFGVTLSDLQGLQTVADCLLAAGGIMPQSGSRLSKSVTSRWFKGVEDKKLLFGEGESVTTLFLERAAENPDGVIVADQISGEKTYRELIMGIYALLPEIEAIEENRVGIMLPASVSVVLAYLVVLFSGKEPVMVNWTTGSANMRHGLQKVGVQRVITAGALLDRLSEQGVQLDDVGVEWLRLEQMAQSLTPWRKLSALFKSRGRWAGLRKVRPATNAAVLFTSGSEAYPKAVPLSHGNFLANGRDFCGILSLRSNDRLLGILPPFHSLGLAGTVIMPLCTGLRTVFWPNPTEGANLAKVIELYGVSLLIGVPTFLHAILQSVTGGELETLRLVFTGAERCPDHLFVDLKQKSPGAVLCEGYGVTECSPVISVNSPEAPVPGSIGTVLESMSYQLVEPEGLKPVRSGRTGRLLVRGPNVFEGYLGETKSPFVFLDGHRWYDTGDLARECDGVLTFEGRLKRFVKIGGEMISLPAIEQVIEKYLSGHDRAGNVAVMASAEEEHPWLILVGSARFDRREVNNVIRDAGLSPLHNIREVVEVEELPLLGTGKTDYNTLKMMLAA